MKYTFISEEYNGNKVTHEFEAHSLFEVVEHFELFLKGCSFHFDGTLDIVPNDEPSEPQVDDEPYEYERKLPPSPFFQQSFQPDDIVGADERCKRCGITRKQLGGHRCFDEKCGLK